MTEETEVKKHEHPHQEHRVPVAVAEVVVIEEGADGEVIVDEIIEIEVYARENRRPPHARGYAVLIDGHRHVFHKAHVTGEEILEAAKKIPPSSYILREFFCGGRFAKVELKQVVDLKRHGLERFKTMPKTAQDGQ